MNLKGELGMRCHVRGIVTVREQIIAVLEAHPDWSQTRIAQELGVCRATVNRWLRRVATQQQTTTTPSQQAALEARVAALEQEVLALRRLVHELSAREGVRSTPLSTPLQVEAAEQPPQPVPPTPRPASTLIPADWDLSEDLRRWTLRAAAERGRRITQAGLREEVASFRQYWQARQTRRANWGRTWQEWWRRAIPNLPQFQQWDQGEREHLLRGEWPQYRPAADRPPQQQELPVTQLPQEIADKILAGFQRRAEDLRRLVASKTEAEWDQWLRADHARRNAELQQRGRAVLAQRTLGGHREN